MVGVDLDPGEQGTVGQIINFGRDEDNKLVLAPNLAAFIPRYLTALADGVETVPGIPAGNIGKLPLHFTQFNSEFPATVLPEYHPDPRIFHLKSAHTAFFPGPLSALQDINRQFTDKTMQQSCDNSSVFNISTRT